MAERPRTGGAKGARRGERKPRPKQSSAPNPPALDRIPQTREELAEAARAIRAKIQGEAASQPVQPVEEESRNPLATLPSPWAVRRLIGILVLTSGLLFALSTPAHSVQFAWLATFLPLFLALDLALRGRARPWIRVLKVLACSWPAGAIMALVTGGWVVNTSYVFGGLSLLTAWLVNVLGYGSLIGLEVFAFLGIPFLLTRKRFLFSLLLIPLWATAGETFIPRFLYWTFGQFMFPVPALVQLADIIGSGGLNFFTIPLYLILLAWIRQAYDPGMVPRRTLLVATGVLAVAFGLSYAYGSWCLDSIAEQQNPSRPGAARVHLVGIQPNFSLKDLASNPDLSPSDRQTSLRSLVSDTNAALLKGGVLPDVPAIVVWPESVYPVPYFDAPQARVQVEAWAQTLGVHLLLATQDNRYYPGPDGRMAWEAFGAAVYVPPGGKPSIYHKMNLIPFGETIPFADVIPFWATTLKAFVPRISQFAAGGEPTVFPVSPGIILAPMICFDAFDYRPALGMAGRGANVGVVMANLAWFGRSTATGQMERFIRFRAIETRMPILMLSQNGESVLIDARGEAASSRVGLFEVGALSVEVVAGEPSFYARNSKWVHTFYGASLLLTLALGFGLPWAKTKFGR
jgi:apolipoprotein N-acyltransferase